jgi:hypothetical protein
VWTQQAKLVGTGTLPIPFGVGQGASVSLSDDGNTAIVGGNFDNDGVGAAWVYTRSSGGVWSQQVKLVGTGAVGPGVVGQGASVSLSADGNTAIVGGPGDSAATGAAWVYTRVGTVWSQQGGKLVGTGGVPDGFGVLQGSSVSVSGDGNTAIVGGPGDNTATGAAWVYTRSGGVWTQQRAKLLGTDAIVPADQGNFVSLSTDGNTAIVGGPGDNTATGAAWVYTRSGGVWTQQRAKLVGTTTAGPADQGNSVSLSGDGNTAIVGGPADGGDAGAAWVYTKPAFAGTPGTRNCFGQSVTALDAQFFGNLSAAAAALGFPSVPALLAAVKAFCG